MARNPTRICAAVLAAIALAASVQAQPIPHANEHQGQRCQPNSTAPGSNSENLAEKLDDCNGVLTAPGVGDGDIVEPAPSTGTGRVIDPQTLPPNANPSNGSGG